MPLKARRWHWVARTPIFFSPLILEATSEHPMRSQVKEIGREGAAQQTGQMFDAVFYAARKHSRPLPARTVR
jgi:hypothetical protein